MKNLYPGRSGRRSISIRKAGEIYRMRMSNPSENLQLLMENRSLLLPGVHHPSSSSCYPLHLSLSLELFLCKPSLPRPGWWTKISHGEEGYLKALLDAWAPCSCMPYFVFALSPPLNKIRVQTRARSKKNWVIYMEVFDNLPKDNEWLQLKNMIVKISSGLNI
jgi:hypothetical protein